MEPVYYNKKDVYEEQIVPLLSQIKTICNAEKMPMFISVAVVNSEKETVYANDAVLASTGVRLSDNRIADVLLSLNGLVVDYPEYIKTNLRELEEFIERTNAKSKEVLESGIDCVEDVELTEDKLVDFQKILSGGYKAALTPEMKGMPLDEKYWED